MPIKVGDKIPQATFMTFTADGPAPLTSGDLVSGKTVALFALPGAFTPTCSAKHVPGFKAHAAELKAKGVDAIACVSVNDVFVMNAWGKDQKADGKVLMLADGNGDFTRAMDLVMDGKGNGMGERSKRYAMIVDNGTITALQVEQPGQFEVSSAEAVLAAL